MKQAPTGLVACCNSFLECFVAIFLASRFCSLFLSPHPSNRVSFLSHLKSFGSSLFRTPARASNGRSRACAYLFVFVSKFHFPNSASRFDLNAMASFNWQFHLAARLDLAPFRKNVVHSSPRPRCLGNFHIVKGIDTYVRRRNKTLHVTQSMSKTQ